jgi:hypothetical protein
VDRRLFDMWEELVSLVTTVNKSDEEDVGIIWAGTINFPN